MNPRKIVTIGRNLSKDTISRSEMKSLRVTQDTIAKMGYTAKAVHCEFLDQAIEKLEGTRVRKAASIARRLRDGARIEGDDGFDLDTMTVTKKVRAS